MNQNIHEGDLFAKPGVVYQFEQITGYLDASGADTTAFPKLTTVGGSLYARGADTTTAFPKLTTVGGYLSIYARGADTTTAFPKLTKKGAGDSAKAICRDALVAAIAVHGLTLEDGILSRVIGSRGGVKRVRIVGQAKISYIVQRDGHTAHGATLDEARADLLLKMGNSDTTPYLDWTTETKASLQEMIVAYRTITGACQQGVSHFLTSKNYKGKLSVQFVIDETQGSYGHDAFKAFFTNRK